MNSKISPVKRPVRLAPNPSSSPKYSVKVTNKAGNTEILGCPQATRALVAFMNQHAVIGGAAAHWGGPAAFAEIMSSLHAIMFRHDSKPWYENFNFVNDAGHTENGIYALRANYGFDNLTFNDLKGFRGIESKLTGHGEAHLNPQGVFISNGPLGSGVPQAQGLAMADKILGNNRITLCTISDGACMEGEAKEAFAAIPGLASKGHLNPFVLVVSDNNTKLSGRIDQDSYSMGPTFHSLSTLGFETIFCEQGHDLEVVHQTLESAIALAQKNSTKPIAVIFKTIKGYGNKKTQDSSSGGHGYPLGAYDPSLPAFLEEIYNGQLPEEFKNWCDEILKSKPQVKTASQNTPKEKVQPGFAKAAIEAAEAGLPIFALSSDLQGSTGIADFHKKFPERAIDLGVAESNMISAAIGLSKQGLIPIVDTFAQFGITKGNLPLIMAGLSEGPIIGLFSHAGLQDAADGASHQATTYLAATMSIPHVTTICCSCSSEAHAYMKEAINRHKQILQSGKTPDSVLFFYGRESHPVRYRESLEYSWGQPQILKDGSDCLIVACGPMVPKALFAAEKLKDQGVSATVVNHPFTNRPDLNLFSSLLQKNKGLLITIEDHQQLSGMGQLLVSELMNSGTQFKSKILALKGEFGQSAYQADELYEKHHLTNNAIIEAYQLLTN